MKYFFTTFFPFVLTVALLGQDLAAYSDYRGHFIVFDKGEHYLAEEMGVKAYDVGGECVLFLDAKSDLKMYRDGFVRTLETATVSEFYATDHLAAYSLFQKLTVIDQGQRKTLSYRCPLFRVEDSLLVYYDKNLESLRVYYNGITEEIEDAIIGFPVSHLSSSDNIVAYISSRMGDFKIFYKGRNHTLIRGVERMHFKAGKDIVAFIDPLDRSFKVFYKGEIQTLEPFPPKSFKVGDGFVAYVDDMEYFKVFSGGEVVELSGFLPQKYEVEDNLLVYMVDDYFKVFWQGKEYELEAYEPRRYVMDWNSLAYMDHTGMIWLFSKGEKKFLMNEAINNLYIHRDVVTIDLKMDKSSIYYNDQIFRGKIF